MVRAILLLRRKRVFDDGSVAEVVLWQLPAAVPGSQHRLKYRLYFGLPGLRLVGYDNERGKGDHRHWQGVELPYAFTSLDRLIADFEADVACLRAEIEQNGGD